MSSAWGPRSRRVYWVWGLTKGVRWSVPAVHLVEVDVVGVEAAEAVVQGVHEVLAGGAGPVRAFAHGQERLRGDDDVAAVGLEGGAEVLLRPALAVGVGG